MSKKQKKRENRAKKRSKKGGQKRHSDKPRKPRMRTITEYVNEPTDPTKLVGEAQAMGVMGMTLPILAIVDGGSEFLCEVEQYVQGGGGEFVRRRRHNGQDLVDDEGNPIFERVVRKEYVPVKRAAADGWTRIH